MKIVFFGTPEYVIPVLDSLHKQFKSKSGESPIVAVVSQRPKPRGRKKILAYSPVDSWAHKKKIPVYYDSTDLIEKKVAANLGILAAYGAIISDKVIGYFPSGILNIHPSLLPKFRGASPVQATIAVGDKIIGATIIKLDKEVDHGPIISQFKEEMLPNDTTGSLRTRFFERAAEVLTTLIPAYLRGKIRPRKQEHPKATFTTLLKKEQGVIPPKYLNAALKGKSLKEKWAIPFIKDYSQTPNPESIERFIRAMQPWPIAWTYVRLITNGQSSMAKRLKIIKAHLDIKDRSLVIDEVQLEGKNPVSWKQFIEGYPKAMFE